MTSTAGAPRRQTVAHRRKSMGEESKSTGGASPPIRSLDQGKRQFIIAPRRGSRALSAGLRPLSAGAARAALGQLPGLELVRAAAPATVLRVVGGSRRGRRD